ncbi:MAG TPA: MFS transporter, partial [Pseudolabrys sp.]|nr:MFS transporter [Pseudolabrys sp.]
FTKSGAWSAAYAAMAVLVVIGILTTLVASEPEKSQKADAVHERESPAQRLKRTISGAFTDFFQHDGVFIAVVALVFVVLFKLTDALAGVMTGPFAVELGFSRTDYANIVKGVGLIALLAGGFAGGYIARALPLAASLWIGGILQSLANLSFSWLALAGHDLLWLTVAITVENFTSAIGTVMFVAYLSALCRNPLHTATQYALLTALAAVGRTYLSAGAGYLASATGWAWFFVICTLAGIPSLLLLWWLQAQGHFGRLAKKTP